MSWREIPARDFSGLATVLEIQRGFDSIGVATDIRRIRGMAFSLVGEALALGGGVNSRVFLFHQSSNPHEFGLKASMFIAGAPIEVNLKLEDGLRIQAPGYVPLVEFYKKGQPTQKKPGRHLRLLNGHKQGGGPPKKKR